MCMYVIVCNFLVLCFCYLVKYLWKFVYLFYVIFVDKFFKLSCMFYLVNRLVYIWYKGYKNFFWFLIRCSDRFGVISLWNCFIEVNW